MTDICSNIRIAGASAKAPAENAAVSVASTDRLSIDGRSFDCLTVDRVLGRPDAAVQPSDPISFLSQTIEYTVTSLLKRGGMDRLIARGFVLIDFHQVPANGLEVSEFLGIEVPPGLGPIWVEVFLRLLMQYLILCRW